jgi:putative drug exporter of the RND superfamily
VLVIMALVAFAFRSLLAPLVVVGVAAVGYLVYFPLLSSFAAALGFTVPAQLEPVLVALLLGVVTDYCVLLSQHFEMSFAADSTGKRLPTPLCASTRASSPGPA